MVSKRMAVVIYCVSIVALAFLLGRGSATQGAAADKSNRVFEIRTYTAAEGKLDALLARFRDHTCKLFEKHGMTNIGYWVPADEPGSKDTLVYVLAHESRDAAKKSWKDFGGDPEWKKAREASEVDGKLTTKVEYKYLNPTDSSAIK